MTQESIQLQGDTSPQGDWRPIETAPKDGRALLLGHFNSHGKWRTVRGAWCSADSIAETWEEEADEGWYEMSVECEDVPNCWWTEPTHWMPLPPPPGSVRLQGAMQPQGALSDGETAEGALASSGHSLPESEFVVSSEPLSADGEVQSAAPTAGEPQCR